MLHGIGVAAAGGLLGVLGCSGGGGAEPPDAGAGTPCGTNQVCLDLSRPAFAPLANVGGSVYVQITADYLIVVRVSETQVDALSSVCTHAGCTVGYSMPLKDLLCTCHGSQFNLDGSVARGPAVRPLKTYPATLDATTNIVTITIA